MPVHTPLAYHAVLGVAHQQTWVRQPSTLPRAAGSSRSQSVLWNQAVTAMAATQQPAEVVRVVAHWAQQPAKQLTCQQYWYMVAQHGGWQMLHAVPEGVHLAPFLLSSGGGECLGKRQG